jgi:hypothetical protein
VFSLSSNHFLDEDAVGEYANLPVGVSIQYGFKNPCSVAFFVCPSEGEMVVIDEIYEKETLIADIAEKIAKKVQGKRVLCYLADFWDRQSREEFLKCGIEALVNDERTVGKSHGIVSRVRAVQNALKIVGEKPPRLRFSVGCKNILDDFAKCKWGEKAKEGSDRLESEYPSPKFFQSPLAISHFVTFVETCLGGDIYAVQGRKAEC